MSKINPATSAVQRAQKNYPKALAAVKAYMGPVPYGKQPIDPRTADRRLLAMTPESMTQLAMTDPAAAESAAQRIQQLEVRAAARPPLPSADDYQP
jgi:hypothetical protein